MSASFDPDQRDDALRKANEVRLTNAHTLKVIRVKDRRHGASHAAAILRDPCGAEPTMRVSSLLLAVKSIGPGKLQALLEYAAVPSEFKRIEELTERQRETLADALERRR